MIQFRQMAGVSIRAALLSLICIKRLPTELGTHSQPSFIGRRLMKHSALAAALLVALGTSSWAQSPADHEAHHLDQKLSPATPPSPPADQSGMTGQGMMGDAQDKMGGKGMMNMMGENMPMMMHMMGSMRQPAGMEMIDHVEGRIAFLRAELKITDAQSAAWDAFADVLRANANSLGEVRASMVGQGGAASQTLVGRVALQEKWLAARLEGTRAIKAALTNLVGTLSDDQIKTANELLAPHMGMGMMGMMGGMHRGQMGSGQMPPGRIMPGR